jgi:hypothetical protein
MPNTNQTTAEDRLALVDQLLDEHLTVARFNVAEARGRVERALARIARSVERLEERLANREHLYLGGLESNNVDAIVAVTELELELSRLSDFERIAACRANYKPAASSSEGGAE